MLRAPHDDLPADLRVRETLSSSERARVWLVERGEELLVLRVGEEPDTLAELALAHRVRAPGLVFPSEWGRTPGGRPFTLRPYVPGRTLDQALVGADPATALRWVRELLHALGTLHAAGFVHRDVKARNVIVGEDGVALVDYELCRGATVAANAAGTPCHIAPEVLLGQPHTPSCDLFSLGATLAFSYAGAPEAGFHGRFPRQSFWAASGCASSALPEDLAALVLALVRRHPGERPPSARVAAQLLPPDAEPLPADPTLPFLAGRERVLDGAIERLAFRRSLVVIGVEDPEECEEVARSLHLALSIEDVAGGLVPLADARAFDELVLGAPSPRAPVAWAAHDSQWSRCVEAAAALGAAGVGPWRTGGCALVLPASIAGAVAEELRERMPGRSALPIEPLHWGGIGPSTLRAHLDHLSGNHAPDLAQKLAHSLHERTGGRHNELNRLLSQAEERGVLRASGTAYTLLTGAWPPTDDADAALAERYRALSPGAREVLQALVVLDGRADAGALGEVCGIERARLLACLDELRGADAVLLRLETGAVTLADRRWQGTALALSEERERAPLHRRALQRLEAAGAPTSRRAPHLLALARWEQDFRALLELADAERRRGHLDEARHVALGIRRRLPVVFEELALACEVLLARLELDQQNAEDALRLLGESAGGDLETLTGEGALVAAQALESCGRRAESRALFERVLASASTPALHAEAVFGLAYARFLDGDFEGVREVLQGTLGDEVPAEHAVSLLNLEASALVRLGRDEEALAQAARALERAAGVPLFVGRAEHHKAYVERRLGLPGEARASLERAIAAFEEAGHLRMQALSANNLGVLHRDLGELRRARDMLMRSLALRRRVGDAYGIASSVGNLALVDLEAGHVGAALDALTHAGALMARGAYEAELGYVELHRAMALALAGSGDEALAILAGDALTEAARAHPLVHARALAIAHHARGDQQGAREVLRDALGDAELEGDLGEAYRVAALAVALGARGTRAGALLQRLGEALGSASRRRESLWRLRVGEPGLDDLRDWRATFEEDGRTDLVRAVSLELARTFEQRGEPTPRRQAAARAVQASDSMLEGLTLAPGPDHDAPQNRLDALAGLRAEGARSPGPDLAWFLDWNRRMAAEDDLHGLLLAIVDMALETTEARRGFVLVLRASGAQVYAARGMDQGEMHPEEARFSESIVDEAVRSGEPLLTTDARRDERFAGSGSIESFQLRSVVCVPLAGPADLQGALYLDNDRRSGAFDEADLDKLRTLADQATIAITNLLHREKIETLNQSLSQQVASQSRELGEARSMLRRTGTLAPVTELVGQSSAMERIHYLIDRIAKTDLTVLITGPSGSGKELIARAIHRHSPRATQPFLTENVAAMPDALLESELFGHARGSFTGATHERVGLFEELDAGTFFLDEIGDMSLGLQAKLLRVLESGEFRPVGSSDSRRADVRVLAATHRDLQALVKAGKFREDLYYRLNQAQIRVPGLAERREDIPLLVRHFLDRLAEEHGTSKAVSVEVMETLVQRRWPGEVRELRNEVARLYHLSERVIDRPEQVSRPAPQSSGPSGSLRLADLERAAIARALDIAKTKDEAARLLGISRGGLYSKLKKLGLSS